MRKIVCAFCVFWSCYLFAEKAVSDHTDTQLTPDSTELKVLMAFRKFRGRATILIATKKLSSESCSILTNACQLMALFLVLLAM